MRNSPNLYQSQFFFDDGWIADSVRLQRVWHQAEKRAEPVLRGTEPWEGDLVIGYGSVLHHDGRFKIWYKVWPELASSSRFICYAESDDGIHWHKPLLGLTEFNGNTANNIVMLPGEGYIDCLGIIDDPADTEWPLKMIYWTGVAGKASRTGLAAARSKDGIRWDHTPGLVLKNWGDRTNFMPCRDNGKFVVFGRYQPHLRHYGCRVVSRTDSEDLVHWSRPRLVLKPDPEDEAHLQIYSASSFHWESMYMGFIERMHMTPDVLDPEIWFSHDGHRWQRTRTREAFIERCPIPNYDHGWVSTTCNAPIRCGNELLIHYSGRAHGHRAHRGLARRLGAIGLATLRIDGFCSMQAAERPGWLVTPPVEWPTEAELQVNVDPRRDIASHPMTGGGEVLVEVRNARGQALPGFRFADCVPLVQNTYDSSTGDATCPVRWKDGKGLHDLGGRKVRLAFQLRDAHLYAFKAKQVATG